MNLLAAMRYLVALDQHRHFGRAAQACHVTQPALSNALRALETEFGVPIVKRSRTYAGLTEEGQAVLATAHRLLHETDNLQQQLQSTAASPRGSLKLAAIPTAIPLLAVFAALLNRRHPGLTPVLLAMSSPDIEKHLDDLSLDLAIGYTDRYPEGSRFTTWPLGPERYFLLRRAEGPPAAGLRVGPPMRWRDAARLPLCQLTPDMHNRAIVDRALGADGPPPRPAIETNALLTLTLCVSAGSVCAVLPAPMIAAVRSHGELEALPLVDPDIRPPIGFVALAGTQPSRVLQAALQLLDDAEWREQLELHTRSSFDS